MSSAKRTIIVVVLLGALGGAGFALAATGGMVTPPTITSSPANPTASTSASFSFTDSQQNVTFVCSIDGSAYTACTSPKTYTGLAVGTHTFSVEAQQQQNKATSTSTATSYTWGVDTSAPTSAITSPGNGVSYNGASWSAGCGSGAGACGTATDPSGISGVVVSVKNAAGKYWNGSAFAATSETYNTATLSSQTTTGANWFYPLPLPADGGYTLHVRASDKLGNQTPTSSPASSIFTIDTTSPATPQITGSPTNPTNQTSASFSFTDSEAGVSFLCKLDSGSYTPCTSPQTYTSLGQGSHTFAVEAKDGAGNVSPAASSGWTVVTTPTPTINSQPSNPSTASSASFTYSDAQAGVSFECKLDGGTFATCSSSGITYSNLASGSHSFSVRAVASGNASTAASYVWQLNQPGSFSIAGDVPSPLYPGAPAQPFTLTIKNPNASAITVNSLGSVGIQPLNAPGCDPSWFQIVIPSVPSQGISVAGNGGSIRLAATAKMLDSGTNQDVCRGKTLTLSYTGSAQS